jgi:hypothetical protein
VWQQSEFFIRRSPVLPTTTRAKNASTDHAVNGSDYYDSPEKNVLNSSTERDKKDNIFEYKRRYFPDPLRQSNTNYFLPTSQDIMMRNNTLKASNEIWGESSGNKFCKTMGSSNIVQKKAVASQHKNLKKNFVNNYSARMPSNHK